MHCVLLGICRQLLRLWLLSQYHDQVWYIGTKVAAMDDRLCGIKPPSEIKRTPRSLSSTRMYWKGTELISIANYLCYVYMYIAHELKAWLLHYSPAVLYEILPDLYYQHHLLLVESIFLLLQNCVSKVNVKQSWRLLKHYVILFSTLYGMWACTFSLIACGNYPLHVHFNT